MASPTTWIDYSERMLRAEIAKVPDGAYERRVGWLDDDARNRGAQLPVEDHGGSSSGDEITIDLTGSQRRGADRLQLPVRGLVLVGA